MPDFLIELIAKNPYLVVGLVFVLCGIGLPLPEEIVLVVSGYTVFQESAELLPMMLACAGGMACGDLIPYLLGRRFGVRLLRWRPLRVYFTRERLARFDRWFRNRGDYMVFFARFLAGIRTVAFFTAGTMRMPISRFMLLDGAGILLLVPTFVYAGYHFGGVLDQLIDIVMKAERSVLITVGVVGGIAGIWYVLRRRRIQRRMVGEARDAYVEPRLPVRRGTAESPADTSTTAPDSTEAANTTDTESDARRANDPTEEGHGNAHSTGNGADNGVAVAPDAPTKARGPQGADKPGSSD